jgi:hypothetical protein
MRAITDLLAIGLLLATPAMVASRDLVVPAAQGWRHKATGIQLPPTILDLPRTALDDGTASELDVRAQFNLPDMASSLTLYIFRPATTDVALWFDRSETALEASASFGGVIPFMDSPTAFSRPGSTTRDGLRRVYRPKIGGYHGTALAIMPLGEWLVAIRLSSKTLEPAALDAQLSAAIDAIRFPAGAASGPSVSAMAACVSALPYRHADLTKPDLAQTLLGAVGPLVPEKSNNPAEAWCREASVQAGFGVYRQVTAENRYLIALGDAGRTITVSPEFPLEGKSKGYTIIYHDLDSSAVYPSFDRLPEPAQVIDIVTHMAPLSRTQGKTISITTP